ncbi:MAG: hypothetical protein AABW75_03610 [Nanoarchaeota archaeon]
MRLLDKLKIAGMTGSLALLSACETGTQSFTVQNPPSQSYTSQPKTLYNVLGKVMSDGNMVYEFPRIKDLQDRIKRSYWREIPEVMKQHAVNGEVPDIHYLIGYPNGSGRIVFYEDEK